MMIVMIPSSQKGNQGPKIPPKKKKNNGQEIQILAPFSPVNQLTFKNAPAVVTLEW